MFYLKLLTKKNGIIILHPLLITFILVSSYPFTRTIPTQFWFIIISSYVLAIIFLLISSLFDEKQFYYLIFLTDIPIIGVMIHFTGGFESLFPLLYVLLIIVSSLYLFKKGAYIISLCSLVFYLVLMFIESSVFNYSIKIVMYRFYFFGLLFLLTGILSGVLSERTQLRTEEAHRLRLTTEEIIKNLPSGIITIDNKGEIIYTNITEESIRSRVHLHIVRFLKYPNIKSSIKLKINKRYYVLSCARIYDSKAGLGILQDYTDIKELEEKSRISKQTKLLAELGGSLAHEIRNPLASIRGSLEVIQESVKKKNTLPFVDMALKESIRLNNIVTDFLNFAQFAPVKKNRLHISEIMNEALADIIQKITAKKINIKRQEKDFCIKGDLNKLKSCFTNMLSNAYEASKKGDTITIMSYINKKSGCIEIHDQGQGIGPSEIKRIFEPFFTTKKGGIGLGLSIAKNIVEAHGGCIEVKSNINKGSMFKIILPLA